MAVEWCEKSAEQGNAEAQVSLASHYTASERVAQDRVLAK